MQTLMVRSKVKAGHVADVEAAAEKVFAAIAEAQSAGVHYASGNCPMASLSSLWCTSATVSTTVGNYRMF
jgi:hypothetical protein